MTVSLDSSPRFTATEALALSASVCYAAHNRARNPDDSYQVVTEAAAWRLLERLESCSPEAAAAAVQEACANVAKPYAGAAEVPRSS